MNILIVNTLYYPQGGAPIYGLKLAELLKNQGHNPVPFSMKSPENLQTPYNKYFVSHIDFQQELKDRSLRNLWRVMKRTFHSVEAEGNINRLLEEVPIDIVHLNNFLHHLSLSIIRPIQEREIPIVWSLHDHSLVCPNTNLYNDRANAPCARCTNIIKRACVPVLRRCKKGSFAASAIAAAEAIYAYLKRPAKIPHCFIAPSEFLKSQHAAMGFDVSRFEVVPNFVDCAEFENNPVPGEYALYFGRLSPEKGLDFLISAFAKVKKYPLVIVGTGAAEDALKNHAGLLDAPVKFAGFQRGEPLKKLIYGARFGIMPSVCYENAPLAILESFASGKPVLASAIGGIPELVTDDVGLLFSPGNADAIADKVSQLWDNKKRIAEMGMNARKTAMEKYSPEAHIRKVLDLYYRAKGM
jgi:glycosyltransferase involved in cell wall biosynthesis